MDLVFYMVLIQYNRIGSINHATPYSWLSAQYQKPSGYQDREDNPGDK